MHIFVTGGSGQTGPAVITELITAGHTVTGLARSEAAAATLRGLGAAVHRGSLDDLERLRAGAEASEGVLHMGFGGDFSDPEDMIRRDTTAISALGDALLGSDKPFISTSGTLVMRSNGIATEADAPDPNSLGAFRIPGEQTCLGYSERQVRASVVRLAPTVHGPGDHGFIPVLIAAARRNGVSAYAGDGENRWPAVHRFDVASLFRLALEQAPAGSTLHAVGEEAVTIKSIAEQIGQTLELPTAALSGEQFSEHLANPFLARVFATDAPASSKHTQQLLGWAPTNATLRQDLAAGDYFTPEATARTAATWGH
jgi:nucleoside-diphosphate-sugar epimerase